MADVWLATRSTDLPGDERTLEFQILRQILTIW